MGKGSSLPLLDKPGVPNMLPNVLPLAWIFLRKSQDAMFPFTNYYYYHLSLIIITFLKII